MERVSCIFMMNGAFIFYSVPGHQKIRADPMLSSVISIDIQRNAPLSGLADARSIYFDPFDSSAHGVATAVPPAPGVVGLAAAATTADQAVALPADPPAPRIDLDIRHPQQQQPPGDRRRRVMPRQRSRRHGA